VSIVGVIHATHNRELPRLRWHSLGCQRGVIEVPGVTNLHYASQPGDFPDSMRKAVSRAAHRLSPVADFLADRMSTPGPAFCEILSGDKPQVTVFSEVELGKRTSPMHVKGTKDLPHSAADLAGINVVTGLCLFSNRALRFFDENGNEPWCHRVSAPQG
jgi:hypothetical protein